MPDRDERRLLSAERRRRQPQHRVRLGSEVEVLGPLELVDVRQPHEPVRHRSQADFGPAVVAAVAAHLRPVRPVGAVHTHGMVVAAQQGVTGFQVDELPPQRQPLDLDAVLDDRLRPRDVHDSGRERPRIPQGQISALDREESLVTIAEPGGRCRQTEVRSEQLRVLIAHAIRHPIQVLPVRNGDRLPEPEEILLRCANLPDGAVLHLREVQAGCERPAVPGRHDDIDPLEAPVQVVVHLDRLDPRVPQEPQAAQVALGLFDQLAVERLAGLEQQLAPDDVIARADVNPVGDPMGGEQTAAAFVEDFPADDLDGPDRRRFHLRPLAAHGPRHERQQDRRSVDRRHA